MLLSLDLQRELADKSGAVIIMKIEGKREKVTIFGVTFRNQTKDKKKKKNVAQTKKKKKIIQTHANPHQDKKTFSPAIFSSFLFSIVYVNSLSCYSIKEIEDGNSFVK